MTRIPQLLSIALVVTLVAAVAVDGAQRELGEPGSVSQDGVLRDGVFEDSVSVDLLTVTLRVVDARGNPIEDLAPSELRVRYRRKTLPIVALEWSAGSGEEIGAGETTSPPERFALPAPPSGRVVFWVQPGLNSVRITGHMRVLPQLRRLLRELPPGDLVAVLSFDSRLKLWQDFTRNRELAEFALEDAIQFGKAPPPVEGLPGGLGRHLDSRVARRAATPERAMTVTAEALRNLPGDKALVLVGWGLGRWGSTGFHMTPEYATTLRTLDAARTSVFVLDVTDADYHTLELGLRQMALNTGGSYAKTHLFPSQAIGRLARALGGHYRLTVDRSAADKASARDLRIELVARKGRVLAADR